MRRRDCLVGGGAALGASVFQRQSLAASSSTSQAPEFVGLDGWLNTGAALSIAGLRGKVVLVDFWTYSCINCRRTIPYLNRWQAEYGSRGLQIIGIHTPEFHFEHARTNVAADVQALGIRYPVAQDNAFATWKAWSNHAWPGFYLLDQQGQIVLMREGEGYAAEMEGAIRGLLGLTGSVVTFHRGDDPDLSQVGTPEMYFGALHPTPQNRAQSPRTGLADYSFKQAPDPPLNSYALEGLWERDMEPLVLRSERGGIRLRFSASTLHLVASAPTSTKVQVRVDGGATTVVEIGRPTLYTLFEGDKPGEHRISVQADAPGLTLFSATFG